MREYLRLYGNLYGLADPGPAIEAGLARFRVEHLADAMGHRAVVRPAHARRDRAGDAAPAAPARARRADRLARPRRRAAGPDRPPRAVRRGRDRAARHEPRHGRGLAALRAGDLPLAGTGRRRRHPRRGHRSASADRTSKACSCTWPKSGSPTTSRRPPSRRTTRCERGRDRASGPTGARCRAHVVAHARRSRAGTRTCSPGARTGCSTSRSGRWWTCCSSARWRPTCRAAARSAGERAASYLLAGIVLWHVVYQSQIAVSTGFLEETWSPQPAQPHGHADPRGRVRRRRRAVRHAQARHRRRACSRSARSSSTRSTCRPSASALIPIAAVLLLVGWCISLFVIGIVLRFGAGAEALAWGVMFVVLPLSGVFYPVDALPTVLQPIVARVADDARVRRAARPRGRARRRLEPAGHRGGGDRRPRRARRSGTWSGCSPSSVVAATSPGTRSARSPRRRDRH